MVSAQRPIQMRAAVSNRRDVERELKASSLSSYDLQMVEVHFVKCIYIYRSNYWILGQFMVYI